MLQSICTRPTGITSEQIQLIYLVADLLGPAISNCQLFGRLRTAYDDLITTLSWLIAIVVSGIALYVVRRPAMTGGNLSAGAALMGIGIVSMHYTGMLAFRLPMRVYYHVPTVVLSLLAAIFASFEAHFLADLPGSFPMANNNCRSLLALTLFPSPSSPLPKATRV